MRSTALAFGVYAAWLALAACSSGSTARPDAGGPPGSPGDAAVAQAGDAAAHPPDGFLPAADAQLPGLDAGAFALPGLPHPIAPGAPIAAPERVWSYVAFDDAYCANGSTTGIAINPVAGAKGLVIFLQGGGACWDATTCLVSNTSIHLHEDVKESTVLPEAQALTGVFDRSSASNPFRDHAFVYSAYCTGDMHAGSAIASYAGASGLVSIHHVGARNLDAYLARLVATWPDLEHVLISGISAGGFGATLNWWRVQGAFPHARVDVFDDAGLIVDPSDDRFANMVVTWQMPLPPGCSDCGTKLSAWLPFYGAHLTAPRRYGLAGFLGDAVIGSYFALDAQTISDRLLELRAAAAPNQKTFYLSGTQHSVLGEGGSLTTSDGTNLGVWFLQMATDHPAWEHAGP
jgi:Pectinacetylesterase